MRTLNCWFLVSLFLVSLPFSVADEWQRLSPLPDQEGFAGPFAGLSHGVLIVAGGANFPDKKPWEGGKKVWTDSVFVLEKPGGQWIKGGKLSRPLGYGISVTHGHGVLCVGGSDAAGHYSDAFRLEWKDARLIRTMLPSLPRPLANACGALVGDSLYIAGGQETPDSVPVKTVWRLDLLANNPRWERMDDYPGDARMLAVAAHLDGSFWLIGGVSLVARSTNKLERCYLSDAYRYTPGKGWSPVAHLPRPIAAAPSPAPSHQFGLDLLGGDDGSQVGVAPDKHLGFSKRLLRYELTMGNWVQAGEVTAPRVTVPCVAWGKSLVIPSGEVRPGVRSPDVMIYTPAKKE